MLILTSGHSIPIGQISVNLECKELCPPIYPYLYQAPKEAFLFRNLWYPEAGSCRDIAH